MKLFNPFKSHIATYKHGFVIRKLSPLGWVYLDKEHRHWWYSTNSMATNCVFSNTNLARARFSRHIAKPVKESAFYETL